MSNDLICCGMASVGCQMFSVVSVTVIGFILWVVDVEKWAIFDDNLAKGCLIDLVIWTTGSLGKNGLGKESFIDKGVNVYHFLSCNNLNVNKEKD